MSKKGGLPAQAGIITKTKIILTLALVCAGFFCIQNSVKAVEFQDVIINEIAWMGSEVSSSDEWIELKSISGAEIDLAGWQITKFSNNAEVLMLSISEGKSIQANGYFLIANYSWSNVKSILNIEPDLINTAVSLVNTKLQIKLYDGDWKSGANLIDMADDGTGDPLKGEKGEIKKSMERNDVPGDGALEESWHTCSQAVNLDNGVIDCGTPRADNSVGENNAQEEEDDPDEDDPPTDEEEPDEPDDPADEPDTPFSNDFKLGDIVINEFVSDPADGEVEWVELYNTTGQIIDLTDWQIEEGSGAKTSLEGEIDKFLIIEKPKGNLNNKGDIIILRDGEDNLIDQVAYGEWDDGNVDNNAPVVSDPNSVARKFDGLNSYNNANDFVITIIPTKGDSNIISEENMEELDIEEMESGNYDYSDNIIITEIFPNPSGSDTETEFIEIYNKGDKNINLLGWRLGDESKKRFEFKEEKTIGSKEYLVIYRDESKIALNNTNDSVKLFQPLKDEPVQIVKYEKAVEDWSYSFADLEGPLAKYAWTELITPGKENIVKIINHPPEVEFDCPEIVQIGVPVLFDSSDTVDEDEDELEYSWDFGDGFTNSLPVPEHTYFKTGAYTVKLVVSDGENEVEKEKIIKVVNRTNGFLDSTDAASQNDIIINEFLPNPEGSDADGEFIEIYNKGNETINLLNWTIDDDEGGSKPYKFIDDIWLGKGMYYLLDRADSRIALNNNIDAVRLFNDLEELIDEVEYSAATESTSYSRGENGKWFWTDVLTPSEENIISVSNVGNFIPNNSSGIKVLGDSKEFIEPIMTTLEKIKELDSGDLVIVKGIVAVLPGILGSQYFYIVGSAGIQIYSYKKDFPQLSVGDYIEVIGELSVVSGEMRIKTKQKEDMNILENREEPTAQEVSCDNVNEELVGSLVKITGEIVERKSSIIYLDDGMDEALVYLKSSTGINPKSYNEGEMIEVTGIVGRTKTGIRIMPRSKDDIIKKDVESNISDEGKVLGEVAESDTWAIESRDKKLELFKYLLVIAVGIIIVLAGLLTRELINGTKER